MSSIFNTAISGINAMKIMIDHTVEKINNPHANNSNQRIFIENPIQGSNTNTNTALKVKEIYDDYNDFITEEKRKTDAQIQDEETKIEKLRKLEDLLCEKSNIFHELINDLYDQIKQDIIVEHKSTINEKIRNKLSDIMFAIKDFDKKLHFFEKDIKESIINNIKKVNTLIDQIHDLTIDIRYFPISRENNTINGLIEKRENLVDKLNALIGVKVVKDHNNYKIYLNNGISLIDNNHKQNLIPLTSTSDERYISIGYIDNDEKMVKKIENMVPSAILGSLLQFRKEDLNNARNKIGQLTVNFADSMNEYHKLGYDIFGNHGKQIFSFSNPESIASSSNTSSTKISTQWYNSSSAQDTDYIIYFKNNIWTVTRMLDHTSPEFFIHHKNDVTSIEFDGMQFFIEGKNVDGDIYMIKPYSKTLETLEILVNVNDPFAFSSTDNLNYQNRNNAMIINKFYEDLLVNRKERLDESYQKFSKSIAHKCDVLEERLPFKKSMIRILENKKLSMSDDINKDYSDLNYQQECYLANVKVLEVAENIFNEIVDEYS